MPFPAEEAALKAASAAEAACSLLKVLCMYRFARTGLVSRFIPLRVRSSPDMPLKQRTNCS